MTLSTLEYDSGTCQTWQSRKRAEERSRWSRLAVTAVRLAAVALLAAQLGLALAPMVKGQVEQLTSTLTASNGAAEAASR